MRTTIELKDEDRARLLALAASRGEKGFSKIIGEAVEMYLKTVAADVERRDLALVLRGRMGKKEAEELRKATTELRKAWR
jgi:hypothetical protein